MYHNNGDPEGCPETSFMVGIFLFIVFCHAFSPVAWVSLAFPRELKLSDFYDNGVIIAYAPGLILGGKEN